MALLPTALSGAVIAVDGSLVLRLPEKQADRGSFSLACQYQCSIKKY